MIQQLESLLAPAVAAQGCELYDIEYVKEGGDRILRLYIDKPDDGGVNLDDCERVSHAVEAVLDEHDPISTAYRLQVGSPGIERKLVKPWHFAKYVGHKINLKIFEPIPDTGRKKFAGILSKFSDDKVTLTDHDDEEWTFGLKEVSSCRLVVFD